MEPSTRILFCFIALFSASVRATFVDIPGCPSLYSFDMTKNQTLPPCFCDNATDTDNPPIQVNCFVQSTFDNLTRALDSVHKSGKNLTLISVEYMKFDEKIGIPDNYFRRFGHSLSEITIVGCPDNERLVMNHSFSGLEKSLKKLYISRCILSSVPPSLANLASLESLTLEDTFIYNIQKEDFRGLHNLKYFNLVGNQISNVEEGAFDDLRSVETAVLGPRNSLNESHLPEVNKLTGAKTIVLYNNYLHSLPDRALDNLTHLQDLDLSTNYVENITVDSFAGLTNLSRLNLDQNLIRLIDDGSFRHLKNLRELSMEANFVEDIWHDTFDGMDSLEQLNLNWNNFYGVVAGTFAAMPRLRRLKMGKDDNLQYLDPNAFDGLENLRDLNMTGTNMSTIQSEYLQPIGLTLESLDVSKTNLYYLSQDSFQYGSLIKNLSLADTQLTGVPTGAFSYLTHVEYLDLSNNKWICDDQLAWTITWLKDRTTKANMSLVNPDETACWEPLELRNQPLLALDPSALRPYVAPSEIDQPEPTTTTDWPAITTTDTNGTNSSLPTSPTAIVGATTTTGKPAALENNSPAVKGASDNGEAAKVRIVIAIVVSIVAVATIAVIAIVVLLMRRRKRKQNLVQQQTTRGGGGNVGSVAAAHHVLPPLAKTKQVDETEMRTTRQVETETKEPIKNGHGPEIIENGHQPTNAIDTIQAPGDPEIHREPIDSKDKPARKISPNRRLEFTDDDEVHV